MKKLLMIWIILQCTGVNADERYAHEYYSDDSNERRHGREWYESEDREQHYDPPRYPQNYQPSPIQIYMTPPSYNRHPNHYPNNSQERLQNSNDSRWRERRYELQQMPQSAPYLENQFNRDDTHW